MEEAIRSQQQLPLPRIILAGGRRGWTASLIAGAVLGGVGLLLPAFLSDRAAFVFFGVFLGMIAGVYFGFALTDGRLSIFRGEYVGLVIHGTLAVLSLSLDQPLLLVAGYIGHGVWDAIHPHTIDTRMPWWYVPACIGFDFVFGVYILFRFI